MKLRGEDKTKPESVELESLNSQEATEAGDRTLFDKIWDLFQLKPELLRNDMKSDNASLRNDMKSDSGSLRNYMKSDSASLRNDINEVNSNINEVKSDI